MNSDLIKEYARKFQTTPSIINWAEFTAVSIWQKIGFCRSVADFNMHENTVTQELIYSFWQLAISGTFPVQIYHAKNERANGNDIEIAIETSEGYLLFPCQAKIVNKKGRYPGIRHKVAGQFQIDRLLEYSRKVAGVPIYFFYNFGSDPEQNAALERFRSFDVQRLGCSLFPAEFIKYSFYRSVTNRWSIPDFYKAHRLLGIPFSNLFKLINSDTIPGLNFKAFSGEATFYSRDELSDNSYWRNLAPRPAIGRIPTGERIPVLRQALDSGENAFNPAFRILFSIERDNSASIIRS